jgi:hypothetical protein
MSTVFWTVVFLLDRHDAGCLVLAGLLTVAVVVVASGGRCPRGLRPVIRKGVSSV